jgi:IS1 family transposase
VWIWLALDRDSREVLGVVFGKRDAEGARALVSCLVRKTFFSKKLENHMGAIIYFINHYNKSLLI